MTDPQTAADAAERVQRWLDAYDPDAPAPDPATAMYRRAHELRTCFAGRLFAAGYDPAAPGVAAGAASDATGDTQTGERRADGQRDLTKLEGPQRGSQGDGAEAEGLRRSARVLGLENGALRGTLDRVRREREQLLTMTERQRGDLKTATARAEQAETALAELRGRYDVLGQTRAEIAIELRNAARWHPDNAAWTQDMDQAAQIVEIGMDTYATENGLPRLGGFIREHADATPRTAPERAADEQGDGEGGGDE